MTLILSAARPSASADGAHHSAAPPPSCASTRRRFITLMTCSPNGRTDARGSNLFRAVAQLGGGGAFLHHREIVLHAFLTHDKRIVLADLALYRHQPRLGIGIVILAVVGKDHRGPRGGGGLGHALLGVDIFVPALAVL